MSDNANGIYSFHTFLFPFIWSCNTDKASIDTFKGFLDIGKRWLEAKLNADDKISDIEYNAYQYFTEAADSAIFNLPNHDIVECYKYNFTGGGKYIITKQDKSYELNINAIKLNVYHTGVAILIFELENSLYRTIEEVNLINEHGRRISFPYMDTSQKWQYHSLCANKIEISIGNESYIQDFEEYLNDIVEGKKVRSLTYIMNPIKVLIGGNSPDGTNRITSNAAHSTSGENGRLYIKPCVDDRMFVCCFVLDADFIDSVKEVRPNGEYAYLSDCDKNETVLYGDVTDKNASTRLYELFFVENGVTCHSKTMRRRLLTDCVYDRWINAGTLYGITRHSFVCLTNYGGIANAFLTLYVQMTVLALAQYASIHLIGGKASNAVKKIDEGESFARDIGRLYRFYAKTRGQLMTTEATVQEQGIEIYDMLLMRLNIRERWEALDRQMSILRDIIDLHL